MAAAVQCTNASITIALAEQKIRDAGIETINPMGTTCINPCKLLFATEEQLDVLFSGPGPTYLPVTATTELVYNSVPTKLGTSCIRTAAGQIARMELSHHLVSRSMYSDPMLTSICRSIGGGYEIDSIWASIVLVVFLSHDPRGRRILSEAKLTDMDLQTALILENYGRSEITRRVRLLDAQAKEGGKRTPKKQKTAPTQQAPSALSEMMACDEEDDTRTLGTKRRRSNKTLGPSSNCDSYVLIDWWFRALRSNQASVLETLIASSRQTAREAAKSSLKRQAGNNQEVAANKKLTGISVTTAVKSCEELVRLVHHPVRNIPKIVCAKTIWHSNPVIGILQTPDVSNQTAMYACLVPRREIQPCNDTGIVVLHASGMQEIMLRSEVSNLPCIMERYSRMAEIREDSNGASSGKSRRILSSIDEFINSGTKRPILATYAGMTRSFINIKMTVPVSESMHRSSNEIVSEAVKLYSSQANSDAQHSMSLGTSCSITAGTPNSAYIRPPAIALATSQDDKHRVEPLCTPCSRLGIGIRINELLRRWMIDRTRKNGIAAVLCGLHTVDDIPKDLGLIMDSEPLPMAIIVDLKTRSQDLQETHLKSKFETVGASLNVCMDGAIRVPELVSQTDKLFERRALMITASSQASYISDAGSAMSAQWANCSSASSKKVSCADVNTLLLLNAWDVYAGGITNVHRNYTNTAYSGAYGSHVDTGITSPGLLANYYKADKRQHGTVSLGQEMADEMCKIASSSHFIPVGDSYYAASPIQTSGIPHGFVPGLHTVLNDYHDALETYRRVAEREDEPTVDGLFSLPFSAFTQALPPDVESTVDLTIRHAFRKPEESSVVNGRSYLSDTTSEEEAIFVEPMWRRPCQVCSLDNPFSTSYSYADTVFNVCSLVSLMIVDIGTRLGVHDAESQVDFFHDFVSTCVFTDKEPDLASSPSYIWACDFLVLLFGVIYPSSHAINEQVVPIEISTLASRMATKCKKQEKSNMAPLGTSFSKLILPESLSKVQTLWSRFSKRPSNTCAWQNGIKQLLVLLVTNKGCHNVSKEMTASMRQAVDAIPQSAWLAYSVDGKSPPPHPNPLSECQSPMHVQRTHLDPVFCAMGKDLEIDPRGALVGLQPFQLRQVYILMLGSHLKNAKPQVVRNEGGLNLRFSSAADILEQDGNPRSDKAISPLQVEADSDAFGTRESKLYGAHLQRSAWDKNAKLLSSILTRIEPPQDKDRRARGEWGEPQWLSKFLQDERESKKQVHDVEKLATNQLEEAARRSVKDFSWAR